MKVFIENLSFKTIIGILPFERVKKQKVVVDITFNYKFDKKSKDFIDYSEVSKLIENRMKKRKYLLIEDAITELSYILKSKYKISKLKLKISKPDILKNCKVSISN